MSEQDLKTTLELLNPWWEGRAIDLGIERIAYLEKLMASLEDKRITMVTGSRRVGKTYLLFQAIYRLIEQGSDPKEILFLSLDNANLKGLNLISTIGRQSFRYVFLDEIQSLDQWESIIKSLYDLPLRSLKIICSGSMSFLLTDQKGLLTGRNTSLSIFPLSFEEFELFSRQKNYDGGVVSYLEYGGYPEFVLERHPNYHAELVNDILQKDLIAHFGIRRIDPLRELLRLLAKHVGYKTSLNKLANVLKITDDTVKSYIEYLSRVFLIYALYKYSPSINDRLYSDRKYYFGDLGMRNFHTGFEDIGSLAENAVFIRLRQQFPQAEIFYGCDSALNEVDFIVKEKNSARLVEVKFSKYPEKILNKISPTFLKDPKGLKIKERTIVTDGVNDQLTLKKKKISLVALENFLKR